MKKEYKFTENEMRETMGATILVGEIINHIESEEYMEVKDMIEKSHPEHFDKDGFVKMEAVLADKSLSSGEIIALSIVEVTKRILDGIRKDIRSEFSEELMDETAISAMDNIISELKKAVK